MLVPSWPLAARQASRLVRDPFQAKLRRPGSVEQSQLLSERRRSTREASLSQSAMPRLSGFV
jgi:hypothetical protein